MTEPIIFYRASGPDGYLSNLYPRPIAFEGREFRCSEYAYQFGKAARSEVAEWLLQAPNPRLCALAAHALLVYDVVGDWSQIKVDRMRRVLEAKFTQHQDLRDRLIATGDAQLLEDSRIDAYWGIGRNGKGHNMLGALLMELRAALAAKVPA